MLLLNKPTEGKTTETVLLVGLGGAGIQVLDRLVLHGLQEFRVLAIDTDIRKLESCVCPEKLQIGAEVTRGLGSAGDPELGALAVKTCEQKIRESISEATILFLVCGLGGGTATGGAQEIARMAAETGRKTVALVTLPFSFEGRRRAAQAEAGLDKLVELCDALYVLPGDAVISLMNEITSAYEAYELADEALGQIARGLFHLLSDNGFMTVDWPELVRLLEPSVREPGRACWIGWGESASEDRASEVVAAALGGPFLSRQEFREQADDVLVSITGGPNMLFSEVDLIIRKFREAFLPDTKIRLATRLDSERGDELSLMVIAARTKPVEQVTSRILEQHIDITDNIDVSVDQKTEVSTQLTKSSGESYKLAGEDTEGDLSLDKKQVLENSFPRDEKNLYGERVNLPTHTNYASFSDKGAQNKTESKLVKHQSIDEESSTDEISQTDSNAEPQTGEVTYANEADLHLQDFNDSKSGIFVKIKQNLPVVDNLITESELLSESSLEKRDASAANFILPIYAQSSSSSLATDQSLRATSSTLQGHSNQSLEPATPDVLPLEDDKTAAVHLRDTTEVASESINLCEVPSLKNFEPDKGLANQENFTDEPTQARNERQVESSKENFQLTEEVCQSPDKQMPSDEQKFSDKTTSLSQDIKNTGEKISNLPSEPLPQIELAPIDSQVRMSKKTDNLSYINQVNLGETSETEVFHPLHNRELFPVSETKIPIKIIDKNNTNEFLQQNQAQDRSSEAQYDAEVNALNDNESKTPKCYSNMDSVKVASTDNLTNPVQVDLNFEIPVRGRFEKTDVTIHNGENLDVPTFLRKQYRIRQVVE